MLLVGDHEGLIARVQRRLPGVETTEVEAHMATYCLFATNHQRQVAHRQYKFRSRWWGRSKRSHVRTVRAMPKWHL